MVYTVIHHFTLIGTVIIADGGCNVMPMFEAYGLRSGRDLYRAMPAVTRDLGLNGLNRRTVPFRTNSGTNDIF